MMFLLWLALSLDRGLPRHPVGEEPSAFFHGFATSVCVAHLALGIWPGLIRFIPGGHITIGLLGGWFHGVGAGRHVVAAMEESR